MNKKLLLILFLALILRLVSLNQSLWLDEGIQWWAVTTFPLKHLITEYIKGDFNPPLFHIILYFWVKIFGDSEIALRLPSVLFGLGTVWFTYKLGGLKAALLAATAPLLIYYSQEARMYSLAAFTVTAAMYYFVKRRKLAIIFLSLSLYSHYLNWLLLPVFFWLQPLFSVLAILSFIPFLPIFIQQLQHGLGAATNPVWAQLSSLSVKNVLLVPIKFLIGRLPVDFNFYYAFTLFIPLCLAAYLIFKARNKLLYAWSFTPLILGAFISLKIPVFSYFRFLFVLPAFYLLLVLGAAKTRYSNLLIGFFIGINLLAASRYLLDANLHREDWRSAISYIHATDPNSQVLIISATHSPFEYYDREQSSHIHETDLNRLINQPSVWYIPYAQPIFDPDDKIRRTLDKLGFKAVSERHFRGVTVIRYENPKAKLFSKI